MRGRKPKPLESRKLEGNLGKRAIPEPLKFGVVSDFPKPPPTLRQRGSDEWLSTGKQLWKLKILQSTDLPTFEAYCSEIDRYFEIKDHLNDLVNDYGHQALIVMNDKGDVKQNPYLIIEKQSLEKMTKLGTEFGLTPTSRARLGLSKLNPPSEKDEIEEKYFQRKKRVGGGQE